MSVLIVKVIAAGIIGFLIIKIYRLVQWLLEIRKIGKAIDRFPMNPKHWLWGHTREYPGTDEASLDYFRELTLKYPRACGTYFGIIPKLIVHHPETVMIFLKKPGLKPLNFGIYKYASEWAGLGLVVISGERWARHRKLTNPAFHYDVLKKYIAVHNEAVQLFLEKCENNANNRETMDIFQAVSLLARDIILRCFFSKKTDAQTKKIDSRVTEKTTMAELYQKRFFHPLGHFDFLYSFTKDGQIFKYIIDRIKNSINKVIDGKKEEFKKNPGRKLERDFLDILLNAKDEDGGGLTDREITEEALTFFFAGFDSTASTISWILYSLAEHHDVQKICQEEIDSLMDGRSDESISKDDLQKLNYLTMVIKEGLRLHTIIPLLEREVDSPLAVDGIELPIGTVVTISLYGLHHNPSVWKDPMKFDPNRFLPENIAKLNHYAFIPFSDGPRNCIGQAFAMDVIKLIIARTLRKYNLSVDVDKKVEKVLAIAIKPKNGLHLKVNKRF